MVAEEVITRVGVTGEQTTGAMAGREATATETAVGLEVATTRSVARRATTPPTVALEISTKEGVVEEGVMTGETAAAAMVVTVAVAGMVDMAAAAGGEVLIKVVSGDQIEVAVQAVI